CELTTLVQVTGNGGANQGFVPRGDLIDGQDGYFYGTTEQGGLSNQGTVFKMTSSGTLTTLALIQSNIAGAVGPRAGLVRGSNGDFYGTTYGGGNDYGSVFRMTPAGTLTTLVQFTASEATIKGHYPTAQFIHGADGNFTGT